MKKNTSPFRMHSLSCGLTHRQLRSFFCSVGLFAAVLVCTILTAVEPVAASKKGRFVGDVVAQWLDGGRLMKLRAPFSYIASDGQQWQVPQNTVVDGATIPGFFWSVVGGPFAGKYRSASVIHDYYCDTRTRPWRDVHRVFYEAMLTSGVGENRAWFMYQAVMNFGPRWQPPKVDPSCELPDGTIDFENCSVNSLVASPVEYPKYNKKDVQDFLNTMKGRVDGADLDKVRRGLQTSKN